MSTREGIFTFEALKPLPLQGIIANCRRYWVSEGWCLESLAWQGAKWHAKCIIAVVVLRLGTLNYAPAIVRRRLCGGSGHSGQRHQGQVEYFFESGHSRTWTL